MSDEREDDVTSSRDAEQWLRPSAPLAPSERPTEDAPDAHVSSGDAGVPWRDAAHPDAARACAPEGDAAHDRDAAYGDDSGGEAPERHAAEPSARRVANDLFAPPSSVPPPPAADDDDERDSYPPEGELIAPGTMIAERFRIGRLLGRGGHGYVYEAEHVVLGYPVAIKVLHAAFGLDARRRARFRREALLGARLRHRNVVSIHDAGELEDGSPFLVMEHVDGVDLATVIDRARMDAAATIEVGVQLLAAVTALTERGVIHRDIKPNNVMLQRAIDGFVEVKLLDFGISKAMRAELALKTLTADDCVLGTPQYMSPEQVRGEALDVRADLYAVGCLLYECLTGEPPFDAETAGGVLAKILTEEPRPVRAVRRDVPEALAAVIERAIQKQPDARWRHPAEMSEALRGAAQRLALPRGADAWAGIAYDATPKTGTIPISLVRRASPVSEPPSESRGDGASAASAPARMAETEPERPASLSGRPPHSAPALPRSVLEYARSPRAGRWIALAAALPLALAIGAATWTWDGAATADSTPLGVESDGALVHIGAPKSGAPESEAGGENAPTTNTSDDDAMLARGLDVPPLDAELGEAARRRTTHARGGADPADLEERALSAYLAGREREAVSVYLRATELAPMRASAWRGLGLSAASTGDRRTAARALRRYLQLEPSARDRDAIERRLARLGA